MPPAGRHRQTPPVCRGCTEYAAGVVRPAAPPPQPCRGVRMPWPRLQNGLRKRRNQPVAPPFGRPFQRDGIGLAARRDDQIRPRMGVAGRLPEPPADPAESLDQKPLESGGVNLPSHVRSSHGHVNYHGPGAAPPWRLRVCAPANLGLHPGQAAMDCFVHLSRPTAQQGPRGGRRRRPSGRHLALQVYGCKPVSWWSWHRPENTCTFSRTGKNLIYSGGTNASNTLSERL